MMGYIYTDEDVDRALEFAKNAHAGQLYGTEDYFQKHIMGVVNQMKERGWHHHIEIVVAALHDIFEDTNITREHLAREFGVEVESLVWELTRHKNEGYFDYIRRVTKNFTANLIKTEDVMFNLEQSRLINDKAKMKRYDKALDILLTVG
jgi:(p)ppGpp synthase/HD superfamily hydrolase